MDAKRLGQLLDQHAAALTLYARQWCATPEDVVQEAFVQLLAQKREPVSLAAWLFRVVRNGAISAARKAQRRRFHEAKASQRCEAWFQTHTETALDAAFLAEALQKLSAEPREAITLHLWGGLSFAEIGTVMGCSNSSAHRNYTLGLELLREKVQVCPDTTTSNRP